MPPIDPRYGARQKELRLGRGLSIRTLADKAEVDYTYLARIEQGVYAPPSEHIIVRIARVLTPPGQPSDVVEQELLALAKKPHPEVVEALTELPAEGIDFLRTVRSHPPSADVWKKLRDIVAESPVRPETEGDEGHGSGTSSP
jgi:PTS system nitrogen regulatory IIA component